MKTFFLFLFTFATMTVSAQVTVWTYHNDNLRSGLNTNETILAPSNVNTNSFGKIYSYAVDGYVYAQPLYVPNLSIQSHGTHNVCFIATEHNTVYALDADSPSASSALLWSTNLGAAAVTTIPGVYTNRNFGTRYNNDSYTDIEPEVGITSTPVIDTNTGTIYVDAFTGEVGGGVTNYFHRLHALNITNGTEQPYSPVVIAATVSGVGLDNVGGKITFKAKQQIQRSALTLAGGIVYVSFAGYADTDPYHGWIIGFNATNLQQLTNYTFNLTPNATVAEFGTSAGEGGIWMSGGGISVDSNTNLYFETANGSFNATNNSGKTEYGDCFMKLSTSNGLAVADYFCPWNQATLQANDTDLGSSSLLLLPSLPGTTTNELIGAGKQGQIYVLNRDQFTTGDKHYDATNHIDFVMQTNSAKLIKGAFDTPVCFNNRIYYVANSDYMKSFALTNGLISTNGIMTNLTRSYTFPGATPVISAKGTNNAVIWSLAFGTPQVLVANNPSNITTEIYNSAQAANSRDKLANATKFAAPIVADGHVFVGSSNSISVFGILGGTFSFSSSAYSVNEANTNVTISVNRVSGTNGAVQVTYATSAGTAVNGVNYSNISGTLSWVAGESGTKTFSVPILKDSLAESNPTINLTLSSPSTNSALGLTNTAVLTIIKPPISAWKLAEFGPNANNTAISGDTADPDGDSQANLLEYGLATDPNASGASPFIGHLIGSQFQLNFPRNTSASDLTYNVQSSTNLTAWRNLLTFTNAAWITNVPGSAVSESSSIGAPPTQYVNVTVTVSTNVLANSTTNQFLRLQVGH